MRQGNDGIDRRQITATDGHAAIIADLDALHIQVHLMGIRIHRIDGAPVHAALAGEAIDDGFIPFFLDVGVFMRAADLPGHIHPVAGFILIAAAPARRFVNAENLMGLHNRRRARFLIAEHLAAVRANHLFIGGREIVVSLRIRAGKAHVIHIAYGIGNGFGYGVGTGLLLVSALAANAIFIKVVFAHSAHRIHVNLGDDSAIAAINRERGNAFTPVILGILRFAGPVIVRIIGGVLARMFASLIAVAAPAFAVMKFMRLYNLFAAVNAILPVLLAVKVVDSPHTLHGMNLAAGSVLAIQA